MNQAKLVGALFTLVFLAIGAAIAKYPAEVNRAMGRGSGGPVDYPIWYVRGLGVVFVVFSGVCLVLIVVWGH